MESPRQQLNPATITDMLAFVKSHQQAQQLELPDSTTSPEPSIQQQLRSLTSSPPSSEPPTTVSPMATSDENAVLAAQLKSAVPVVDDKEERPSLSYKDLIIEAIESSPEKRLKLSEIYQVIKYLHPYYKKKVDAWGWQNSIRHNLSLHDVFVKLPLKQTSASGVVGHFWTVVRETEDKQNSSRRRSRNNNNGTRLTRCSSGKVASSTMKGKGRQSVSSDSGVMSDESQANSPNMLMLDGTAVRKDTLGAGTQLSAVASMPQLHRPAPSYPETPNNRSNLLTALALNSLVNAPPTSTPSVSVSESLLGPYGDFASSILMSSALLSRANNNNNLPVSNSISIPTSGAEQLNESNNLEQIQRLQFLNSSLNQNNLILQQAINQAQLFEQEQQRIQSASLLLNQLLALKNQLAKPAASLFLPQEPVVQPQQPTIQQNLLHLLSQQLLQSNQLINNSNQVETTVVETTDSSTPSKNEDLDLVV